MTVAQTVISGEGDILMFPGAALSTAKITGLDRRGVSAVYVHDPLAGSEDVMDAALNAETRAAITRKLHSLYDFVADDEERKARANGGSVHPTMQSRDHADVLINDVAASVSTIIDDVIAGDTLLSMTALKSEDAYAFQHGIDVAVTATLIGRKLWLPAGDVADLAAGCLFIDIGNLAVPKELREFDGYLTGQDRAELQQHPDAGFRIMKDLGWGSSLALSVPNQHHEKQDGTGYPRGLRGTNHVVRSDDDARSRDLITLHAEIASVADVYDALVSDRPYRDAMSTDNAVSTIREMASTALNEEIVETFLSLLPVYQVGRHLEIKGGSFSGARGVVVAQDQVSTERPVLRLYRDGGGAGISTLFHSAKHPDAQFSIVDNPLHQAEKTAV